MRFGKIKYSFRGLRKNPLIFRGMSGESFELTMKYLDDRVLRGRPEPAHDVVVIASFRTRLGVIDCFVN